MLALAFQSAFKDALNVVRLGLILGALPSTMQGTYRCSQGSALAAEGSSILLCMVTYIYIYIVYMYYLYINRGLC